MLWVCGDRVWSWKQEAPNDIRRTLEENMRIKLLVHIYRKKDCVYADVRPTEIPVAYSLANAVEVYNVLIFKTDHLGEVTIIGPGAGRI